MTSAAVAAMSDDIPAVVRVHLDSFPGFFLSSLGPRFLREFYSGLAADPKAILLVARRGDDVIGFVGGAVEQAGFYGRLLRARRWRFAVAALPAVLRHPSVAGRVMRGKRRASTGDAVDRACLMTIGVDPAVEGGGTGKALVKAFEAALESHGATEYCLTTDAEDNDRVNHFYMRLGLTLREVIVTPEGRRLNEYVKKINPNPKGKI